MKRGEGDDANGEGGRGGLEESKRGHIHPWLSDQFPKRESQTVTLRLLTQLKEIFKWTHLP